MKKTTFLLALFVSFSIMTTAVSQQYSGELGPGDNKLSDNEYYDAYYENFSAGERVTVTMRSSDFDAYVMLTDPDGYTLENDDFVKDESDAQLVVVIEKSGQYKILATTYEGGLTGRYTVDISSARTNFIRGKEQSFNGELSAGDNQLSDGEYSDVYYIDVTAGEILEIDLRSNQIDPYLVLFPPTADQADNDDYGKKTDRSHVSYRATESGQYKIMVTTYEGGETGQYNLIVKFDRGSGGSGIRKK